MRIQHNIPAMSSYRNYTNNTSALAKNLEKLSSGYKINRAGDDAAGLAISEKMRAQITGLEAAQKNAKDGISLVQTAEGALTEVHSMLNRMYELAEQSANGTYDSEVDRAQLQKEVESLRTEINRIADSANFNGIKLLDGTMSSVGALGSYSDVSVTATADGDQTAKESTKGEFTFDLGQIEILGQLTATGGSYTEGTLKISIGDGILTTVSFTDADFEDGKISLSTLVGAIAATDITINGLTFSVAVGTDGVVTLTGTKIPTSTEATTFNATAITVALSATDLAGQNNGWDVALHVNEDVNFGGLTKLAQGNFTLSNIKDGTTLKIGNDTYSFKVGKDGVGGSGTVIDLSDMEATDANLLKEAAKRLSLKDNSQFDMTADVLNGKVYLTEKAGKVDYTKDWDLYGTKDNTADATWKNKATSEAVVQIAQLGAAKGKSLTLQIGDDAESYNQLKVNVNDCHADAIGVGSINIGTQDGATSAMAKIKAAINYVSDVRGGLGATQNRLDHTINNLSVMQENIQDAESTIRDVDVAKEMMSYTKNSILVQSAQAMLAQANQLPQGVLQLLQ